MKKNMKIVLLLLLCDLAYLKHFKKHSLLSWRHLGFNNSGVFSVFPGRDLNPKDIENAIDKFT